MKKTKPRDLKPVLASLRLNTVTYRKVCEKKAQVNSAAVRAICDGRMVIARRLLAASDRMLDVQLAADYAHVWR